MTTEPRSTCGGPEPSDLRSYLESLSTIELARLAFECLEKGEVIRAQACVAVLLEELEDDDDCEL